MSRSIITGIDIGTYHVKVVIAEAPDGRSGNGAMTSRNGRHGQGSENKKNPNGNGFGAGPGNMSRPPNPNFPKILGMGMAESKGLRHGYITNVRDVARSVRAAIAEAEKRAQVKVKRAFISVGGIGLGSIVSTSSVIVTKADTEITALDIEKLKEQCQKDISPSAIINRKILHEVPLSYKIDGKAVLGDPEGMKANKLEVRMLFITCLEHHLNDLVQAVEEAGVTVQDVMAAPIAASLVTLSKTQKIAGCILANIGAETVAIAVFENNMPVSLEVFPIGSTDITNDIALGLKVPLEEAEQIKIGVITGSSYPRKKLEEIIEARLSDIFELIDAHLKKIGRSGLLPAGIVITGGGAGLGTIEDLARAALRLPSKVGRVNFGDQEKVHERVQDGSLERTLGLGRQSFRDATWAVAYGLCILGMNADEDSQIIGSSGIIIKSAKNKVVAWFKQFLP
jgi:cell division protein FtsA